MLGREPVSGGRVILEALLGAALAFAWGMVAGLAIADRQRRHGVLPDVTPWRSSSLGEDNVHQASVSPYRMLGTDDRRPRPPPTKTPPSPATRLG